MTYWVAKNGQKQGPYSLEDLQRMLAGGSLAPTDLVWKDGMTQWAPMLQVVPAGPPPAATPAAAPPPAQGPAYWVARGGQKQGPYLVADLQRMLAVGALSPADFAWKEGMAQWVPLGQVVPATPPPAAVVSGAVFPPPMPPNLHWGLVWLFGALTAGIFIIVWLFIEASYVKKLDPHNNSTTLLIVGLVLLPLAGIFFIIALFGMRRSLLNYYNLTEPIGLRLSGAMTFFFGILYLQHHFSRIYEWKRTGVLFPQ
jgi:hypothetical protein